MNATVPLRKLTIATSPPEPLLSSTAVPVRFKSKRPRLGFLGVGWIGRHRLEAIAQSGCGEIAAIIDPCEQLLAQARTLAPAARCAIALEDALDAELDGLVIATPSALHCEQAVTALDHGLPVFCQKPLGRSAAEAQQVITTAKRSNLLLGVDLSYRFMTGTRMIRELCQQGELGEIYAAELVFHNAYGPDKPWFYDRRLSGGGCLIDLGTHLTDLALWCLGFPSVTAASGRLFAQGKPLTAQSEAVEDYAAGQIELKTGAVVQITCSWKLPAGCDAVISGSFYGTRGGAAFRNVNGSFYDFVAERFEGTKRQPLADQSEAWGGRAAIDWAQRLAAGHKFDPEIQSVQTVAETLDTIYASNLEYRAGSASADRHKN